MTKVKIKIAGNAQIFKATLLNNNSAKAFKEMASLTKYWLQRSQNKTTPKLNKNEQNNGFNYAFG